MRSSFSPFGSFFSFSCSIVLLPCPHFWIAENPHACSRAYLVHEACKSEAILVKIVEVEIRPVLSMVENRAPELWFGISKKYHWCYVIGN